MNPAHRGTAATFSMAVKDHLFPKLKFLKGTSASLDFSRDATSICGFLSNCCGVSEPDTYQWWDDHRAMLKNIHTDFRNNKIKMIKNQFNGKFKLYTHVKGMTSIYNIIRVDKLGSPTKIKRLAKAFKTHSQKNAIPITWESTSSSSVFLLRP
jgi:hypothetical protein